MRKSLLPFVLAFSAAAALHHARPLQRVTTSYGTLASFQSSMLPTDGSSPLSVRQVSGGNGTCPTSSLTCPLNELCCDSYCCPSPLPLCIPSEDSCARADGRVICRLPDGTLVLAWPCLFSNGERGCCPDEFPRCSASAPNQCLTEEGFVACQITSGKIVPGVSCAGTGCCPRPLFCCPSDSGCCLEGSGGPRSVAPRPSTSPGAKPVGTRPSRRPKSSRSPDIGTIGTPTPDVSSLSPSPAPVPVSQSPDVRSPPPSPSLSQDLESQSAVVSPTTLPLPIFASQSPASLSPPARSPTTDASMTVAFTVSSETPMVSGSQSPGSGQTLGPPSGNTQTATPSPTSNNAVCFPAGVTVQVAGRGAVPMERLRTGDRVRVAGGMFSEVFMWTHRDASFRGDVYVRVETEGGEKVTATVGHMLYVCRGAKEGCRREVVQIEEVRIGDGVWVVRDGEDRVEVVKGIARVGGRGLYNPQTMHGDVVVDGVLCTCYTQFVWYRVAHGALAPLRALYKFIEIASGKRIDIY